MEQTDLDEIVGITKPAIEELQESLAFWRNYLKEVSWWDGAKKKAIEKSIQVATDNIKFWYPDASLAYRNPPPKPQNAGKSVQPARGTALAFTPRYEPTLIQALNYIRPEQLVGPTQKHPLSFPTCLACGKDLATSNRSTLCYSCQAKQNQGKFQLTQWNPKTKDPDEPNFTDPMVVYMWQRDHGISTYEEWKQWKSQQ